MWIWILSQSGGSAAAVAKQANKYGIDTVFIKSSDSTNEWSQFTPGLVKGLHKRGLHVCAWQYVYGSHPTGEAKQGIKAKLDGADCLVIDAEAEYEGRYAAASIYMRKLRHGVGQHFPIALAGFPWNDYHPGYPYSVFLGPGAAQHSTPQCYWRAIGTSPQNVLAHMFIYNRIYRRPIEPLGQTYQNPPPRELAAFRHLTVSYGFHGLSWWSWQETQRSEWKLLARPNHRAHDFKKTKVYPGLSRGSAGDSVVWAQEHLVGAGEKIKVDGRYGSRTKVAVEDFQSRHNIRPTGTIGPFTWKALLQVRPVRIDWSKPRKTLGKAEVPPGGEPASADLPAVRYEIPRHPPGG
jgi:peptidoglycan hydrolase-like protein with peptidoglycan-binding domain